MTVVAQLADRYLPGWRQATDDQITAPCPFHQEKTPGGFYINTRSGLYFCHGCRAAGNFISLMRELDVPLRLRAELAEGLEEDQPKKRQEIFLFSEQFVLNEQLLGVFDYCPTDLLEAGFSRELLRTHDVGYDRELERITFPLRDIHGRLVGISGRTTVGDRPKYQMYKAKHLVRFNGAYRGYTIKKSNYLWRMDRVYPRLFFGEAQKIYLVEGYKACLWLVQHGWQNTVALQGVYLSNVQLLQLQRLSAEVVILLDNTEDARKAALDAAERLYETNKVRICSYPSGMFDGAQPDDLDEEPLKQTLDQAQRYYWRKR